ncbi:MAG: Hpt domain-containing protein [Burkholderiales bacterium]|nr:Hpt domain-containing protein [Burkholderiales bacterium]
MRSLDAIRPQVAGALHSIERILGEGDGAETRNAALAAVREAAGVLAMAAEAELARQLGDLAAELEQSQDDEFGARATGWIAVLASVRRRVEHTADESPASDNGKGGASVAMVVLALIGDGGDRDVPSDREPLRLARARYERTLLQALKGAATAGEVAEMVAALESVELHFAGTRDASFWTLMAAALDAIRNSPGELDAAAKRFCGAVNLALRRAQDGESAVDSALGEAAIAIVSRSTGTTPRIERVRAAADSAGTPDAVLAAEAVQRILQRVASTADAIERLAAGDVEALSAAEADLAAIESDCNAGGARRLGRFAAAMAGTVRSLHGRKASIADGTALAIGLQLLEQALQVAAPPGAALQAAIAAMSGHLTAMADGADPAKIPDGVNTRAGGFDRAGVVAAGKAIQSSLAAAEAALETYFQASGDAAGLEKLPAALGEVAGTLAMLAAPHAERTARECATAIAACSQASAADREAFDRIAEQVAALGAFVEVLIRDGNAREDDHPFCCSAPAAPVVALTGNGGCEVEESGEIERPNDPDLAPIFLNEAREVLSTLESVLASGASAFDDRNHAIEARRGFHTLKGSGRMVGLERFAAAAWCVEEVLNAWLEQGRGSAVDLVTLARAARARCAEWIEAFEARGEARIDARRLEAWAACIKKGEPIGDEAPASPAAAPSGTDAVHHLSANLYGIFREEAARHLASMREAVLHCREDATAPVTQEFMLAAHTLASACATMRLPAASELGGELEALLVDLLRLETAPAGEHLELFDAAIHALERMIAEGVAHRVPARDPGLCELLATTRGRLAAPGQVAHTDAEPEEVTRGSGAYHWAAGSRRRFRPRDELDTQLVPVFLEEAQDLVPRIGAGLREWRAAPDQDSLAHGLLRQLHTLKGSARMAGAMGLGELTHAMETRVERALAQRATNADWFDAMESSFDRLIQLVDEIAEGRRVAADDRTGTTQTSAVESTRPLPAGEVDPVTRAALRIRADVLDRIVNQSGEVGIARTRAESEVRALKGLLRDLSDNVIRLRAQLRDLEIHAESQLQATTVLGNEADASFDPLEFDRYTRFQELTRMMAESLSDVTVVQQSIHKNVDDVSAALSSQAVLSRDLQQELMRVRMVPFSSIAERLHRIVRASAKELGKRANLDIAGLHAELDRVLLERMTAPLEHLLRNAVSHGLEDPVERHEAGKPDFGTVRIEIRQDNNEIVLTLRDDGRGIDAARVRARAVESGLSGDAATLSEAEALELIFVPGFSTAERVTELSGRGVGLDVVRTEVKALGGRVAVTSRPGAGTTFTLHLPLTLSVTRALLARADGRSYALPAGMVEQVLLLDRAAADAAVAAGRLEWRGSAMPLHFLPHVFGAPNAAMEARKRYPVVILRSGSEAMAVVVDGVSGSRDIVLKNLGPQLSRLAGLIGASILPDGEVALLINPMQSRARNALAPTAVVEPVGPGAARAQASVLVVDDSITVRRVTHRLLSRQGYDVVMAKDGVEALERLQEARPAVMLVDIEMPRMDGFELTRLVRSSGTLKDIPIIMITSRAADKHRSLAADLGVDVFLGKPYSEQELLQHLQFFTRKAA